MHGLVLLGAINKVLRPVILWNDTRNTRECEEINATLGESKLLKITKNIAIERFTLLRLLWIKNSLTFPKQIIHSLPDSSTIRAISLNKSTFLPVIMMEAPCLCKCDCNKYKWRYLFKLNK